MYFNVTQWDPYVGFTMIPNIEGYSKTEDYEMFVKINSRGLRDREIGYNKSPNTFRIGVFGDSFTFGEGVQNNETYPKVLENMLVNDEELRKSGLKVEVINFAIGKTATSHQLAFYQKEGRKYQLDLIVLGFLSGNDFRGNWSGVFYLQDDQLVHDSTAFSTVRRIQKAVYYIPFYKWLAKHSHLANFLRKAATIYDDKARIQNSLNRKALAEEDKTVIELQQVYLTLRLIEIFQEEAMQNGSRFMIVNLPAKGQKPLYDYSDNEQVPSYAIMYDHLQRELNEQQIPIIDLVPLFAGLPQSQYYFEHGGHMTKRGHRLIALQISENISSDISRHGHSPGATDK